MTSVGLFKGATSVGRVAFSEFVSRSALIVVCATIGIATKGKQIHAGIECKDGSRRVLCWAQL